MDRKIEKAIEAARLATKDLLQEFISILNSAVPNEEAYKKAFEKWVETRLELEKLCLSIAIGEFEFKYSVYQKTIKTPKKDRMKKPLIVITNEDEHFLESLKIIPPGKEPKDEQ